MVGRIQSLKPNIVIVQKSVSGMAQDMLRDSGITLILDVKPSIISRIKKCLQCDIVTSVDSNIGKPILGTCSQFEMAKFAIPQSQRAKHIIVLRTDGHPRNCCVLLRGGTTDELIKVKRITREILFSRYNWRFEASLLSDEFAFYDRDQLGVYDYFKSLSSMKGIGENENEASESKVARKRDDRHSLNEKNVSILNKKCE